jgi:uncharacterized membrane protein SirB2
MDVALLRSAHIGAVIVSGALFLLRGGLMLADSPHLQALWLRFVPHVVDSVLLASAIGLVLVTGQYPWQHPWLATKLCALVIYILLGSIALRRGRTPRARLIAFCAAVAVFAYIVGVALTRDPALGLNRL